MRIITVICWIIAALALAGLAFWFLTGTVFGIGRIGVFTGLSIGSGWDNVSGSFEVAGTYNVKTDNVDSVHIDWVSGEVVFKPYDGNEIKITEFAKRELRDDERLNYSVSGDTLTIKYIERDFSLLNMTTKKLEVLVPSALGGSLDRLTVDATSASVRVDGIKAAEVKIDAVSGSLHISNIASKTFKAETTSGSITLSSVDTEDMNLSSISGAFDLSDVKAKTIKCDSTSGSQDLSGSFDSADLESISGRVSITSAVVPASIKAHTTSGSINIRIPDEGPISVNHSSVSGRLTSDIPIITNGSSAQFHLSTVSGGVKITAHK
jgi:DUF4097 and DUF4098 domain-containing protein YvlB